MSCRALIALAAAFAFAGCAQNPVAPNATKHLSTEVAPQAAGSIPAPVEHGFALPRPKPSPKSETHSVVVHNVKAQELLFALARDARINVDVHPGLDGTVTLNALDQTLPQLLDRIAQQVDMRWELRGDTLIVKPDAPFLRLYKIDYLNMARDSNATVSVSSELGNAGGSALAGAAGASLGGGSNSSTRIENVSRNRFWETLIQNLKDLLRETDKIIAPANTATVAAPAARTAPSSPSLPGTQALALDKYLIERCRKLNPKDVEAMQSCYAQTSQEMLLAERSSRAAQDEASGAANAAAAPSFREAASVIASPESGVISVRATARQHEKVQEFLDRVLDSARRQVLIEATIAEVDLSQNYQQGIDWSKLDFAGTGFSITQRATGNIAAPASSLIEIALKGGSFSGSVKLLESFGNVKVLSSPKISVLNNQTAVLKVVDNSVYFTIEANVQRGTGNNQGDLTTYNTTVHTVPIGLVLNVTPQIGDNGTVILNVRPSLSRIVGKAIDPNPLLKGLSITNEIPIVRAREIESVIRVENGNIAIMGGLMEDAIDLSKDTVPGAASLPLIGGLFQNRNDTRRKGELVILLRPTLVRQASIEGDYAGQRGSLPKQDFFGSETGPGLLNLESLGLPKAP